MDQAGDAGATRPPRPRSLRAVGRVARGFGLAYSGFLLAASLLGSVGPAGAGPAMLVFALPMGAMVVRSCMVGIRVRGSELVIVSWFRTYRIPRHSIRDALLTDYSGWFTNFSPSRRIKILDLDVGGRDREFSCTAMTRRGAVMATAELAGAFGLHVRDLDDVELPPMPTLGRWGNGYEDHPPYVRGAPLSTEHPSQEAEAESN
ncbi:hypothetical protein [Agromyces bracchium]|uniref:hypothetical protein n=1 Tax=Agromyces bracchium TaxID=88376 RepID=UPI001E322E34|nr:hypothetical protein [Agromyces bracchium]